MDDQSIYIFKTDEKLTLNEMLPDWNRIYGMNWRFVTKTISKFDNKMICYAKYTHTHTNQQKIARFQQQKCIYIYTQTEF
jgi:hypothetical protein